MPNNDLGTAHGKIVIDTDKRGIDDSDRALSSFEKTVQKLDGVLNKFERVLTKVEHELERVAAQAEATDKALNDLDGAYVSVHKSTTRASKSTRDFDTDLGSLIATARTAHRVIAPLYKVYDHVTGSLEDFNKASSLGDYAKATNRALLLGSAVKAVGWKIAGTLGAFDHLNDRQRSFINLAGKFAAVSAGFAVLNRAVPRLLGVASGFKLANSAGELFAKGFGKVVASATTGTGKLSGVSRTVLKMATTFDDAYPLAHKFADSLDQIGRGGVKMIAGLGIAKSGLAGLSKNLAFLKNGKFQLIFAGVAAGLKLLGPAAEIGAKTLTVLSNAFNLLFNAGKQLAGGLAALPGIYATIGGAVVPLMSTFKRLGKVFGDVLSADDPKKLEKALEAVPDALKPLAKRLVDVKKSLTEIGDAGVDSFLGKDAIKEIDSVESALKGPITNAFKLVNNSARAFRQQLEGTVTDGKNITSLNTIFGSSSRLINNMKAALDPFVTGLLKLSAVGSQFFADFTSGSARMANKFNDFIQKAAETGKLRKWMDDAVSGTRDLVNGLTNATKALWSLLTLFATDSGDNALDRFAKSMKKFNDTVQKSKAEGMLKRIGDAVKGAGWDKLKDLKAFFDDLKEPIKQLVEAVANFSKAVGPAFQDTFIPMVKVATQILESFVKGFAGLEPAIGWVLGIVAGFKLIAAVGAPILRAGQAIAGLILAMKGLKAVTNSMAFLNFTYFLDSILPGASKASGALDKLGRGFSKVGSFVAGFGKALGGIGAIVLTAFLAIDAAKNQIDDFNNTLADNAKAVTDYKEALRGAFREDLGLTGKNVFTEVSSGMSTMMANLQKVAGTDIGVGANLTDFFGGTGSRPAGHDQGVLYSLLGIEGAQTDDFNNLQKMVQDAQHAKKQFDELGLSANDLAAVVTGSDDSFKGFIDTLNSMGKTDAAKQLQGQRDIFKGIQQDFATTNEGSTALVNAITAIGDAGSDTASKLQALRSALQALGLDKTNEIENAFAFSEAIRKMGDEAANLVDQSAGLDKVFGPDGALNTRDGGTNAQNLFNAVADGVKQFQQAAIDTKDVQGSFQRLLDTVPQLAQAFTVAGGDVDKTKQNILNLIQSVGGDNATIKLLLTVTGEDKVQAQIAAILLQYNKSGPGNEIKIPLVPDIDRTALQGALDAALGPGKAAVGQQTLTISGVNLTPEGIAALQKAIPGLELPGQPSPKPAEVQVTPAPPAPGQPPPAPTPPAPTVAPAGPFAGTPVAPPNEPQPPVAVPVDTKQIDDANAKIAELTSKIQELQKTQIVPNVDASQFDTITAKVQDVASKIVQSFTDAFAQAQGAVNNFVGTVNSTLGALVSQAQSWGAQTGQAYAAGLESALADVQKAAHDLAGAVVLPTKPGSPPKEGPLSGSGWVEYSGQKTAAAYAAGIVAGTGGVTSAARGMAGGVNVGMASMGPYDLGKLIGVFSDINGIAGKMAAIFGQVADNIFKTLKFVSDPLGKGTFFGKRLGFKRDPNVSDADLAQQRLQNSTVKAQTPEEKQQADQAKADAEKQNELTAGILDEVVNGRRIAPQTDEEKKQAADDKKAQTKADKAAGIAKPTTKAKTDKDFQTASLAAGADLSAKLDALSPEDLARVQSGEITVKTQDQILAELRKQTPLLGEAIDVSKNPNAPQEQSLKALGTINDLLDAQGEAKTPAAKQQQAALEGLSSTIQSNAGLTQADNPIDTAATIAGGVANVAQDVFASIQSVLDSVGAAKDIGDTLVRGVENTKDIGKLIDDVQQFITTGAQIASAVASGLGVASSIAGAAAGSDPSGGASGAAAALGAASQVASLISAGLSTVNGIIDLTQEVAQVAGKYFGQFLGFLTGGIGGQLMGDIKFLLDTTDGTLKTWSADNPDDKRVFDNPFQPGGINTPAPKIGALNIYPERGTDPAAMASSMMYAVSAAGSGAWAD